MGDAPSIVLGRFRAGQTLDEIATDLHITRERALQLLARGWGLGDGADRDHPMDDHDIDGRPDYG